MIKVLALDSSTRVTGWAVFEDGAFARSGTIDLKRSKADAEDRIKIMCHEIIAVLKKEKPDIIVVEKVSVNRNLDTIRKLSRIIDVCFFYTILLGNVRFHEYSPSEWRSALGMQRRYGGRQIYKALATKYADKNFKAGVEEDEGDAICIGAAYVSEYINMNRYRIEKDELDEWKND